MKTTKTNKTIPCCCYCKHRYEVKYNSPEGLKVLNYCKEMLPSKSGYGVDIITNLTSTCPNYNG